MNNESIMELEINPSTLLYDGAILLRSGLMVHPLRMREEDILIQDIAFALSNTCRFRGHVNYMSVAEHCCNVSDACPAAHKLEGLLHDGPEYVLADLPKPVKELMPEYVEAEEELWRVMARRFNLPLARTPVVKEVDNRALLAERNHLFQESSNSRNWYLDKIGVVPLSCRIRCWSPEIARREFMSRFNLLTQPIDEVIP
jgi:hypothetical protein